MFRNRFLSSVAHFYGPTDKPGEAPDDNDTNDDDTVDQQDEGDDNDADADDDSSDDEGDDESDEDDEGADDDAKPDADATAAEKKDWRDRQLQKQHAKIKEKDRLLAEQQSELETLRAIAEGREPKPAKKTAASADADPVATAKAQIRNEDAQTKFDNDCNKLFADGAKRYPKDWEKTLARLPVLGGVDNETLLFMLATDDPVEALYKVASDPDEYERVMELPLHKRATALAKIGIPPKKDPKRPSNAPDPVVPLRGQNTVNKKRVDLRSENVSDEDWYAERERQRKARLAKR